VGIEAVSFVYISEIFPTAFRAQGVAFSMQGLFLSAILWTAVSSPALASIGWRFYIVFICNSMAMSVVVFFFFPEVRYIFF
jgi:MFS family permease